MNGLNEKQLEIIKTLIGSAPDTAVGSLNAALSVETSDGPMSAIRELVKSEVAERRARLLVFSPLARLCTSSAAFDHDIFPAKILGLLWTGLREAHPQAYAAALDTAAGWRPPESDAAAFDELCELACAGLRARGTAFAPALEALGPQAERFIQYLAISGLARRLLQHMPDWLSRMTEERTASTRLTFRDAGELSPDGGPQLIEILLSHLVEPWQILRVMAAVMVRANDGYIAASELGPVGERLLDDIDRRIDSVRAFDPARGAAAGLATAEAARVATLALCEFEEALELSRDGPWGARVGRQRRELAQAVELRFSKVEDAVAAALPLKPVKYGGRVLRGEPRLNADPDERHVNRAEGLLVFLQAAQSSASAAGYAGARAKVIEKLEDRLDHYTDDLIDQLRDEANEDRERARAFLELAARFIAYVRDEKAAQIVRRRAAA